MDNQLIIMDGISEEEFLAKLNEATGYSSNMLTPAIKYKADEGKFYKTEGDKDEEGKPIYEPIDGDSITVHIIRYRKMVTTDRKAKTQLYSKEFDGDYVELFDENKNVSVSGSYKALKSDNDHLVYVQVLYLYYNGRPYRMKLTGTKLANFFPYIQSANPALYNTKMSKGQQKTNGGITYYELDFTAMDRHDIKMITSRVNAINSYIRSYEQSRDMKPVQEHVMIDEPPMPSDEELNTIDVPF